MRFFTSGYAQDPVSILNNALFDVDYDEMVMVKDVEFYSLCEHHLLPFFGRIHVAYVPDGRLVGLSKIPRLVEMFARRLQVQERLTTQIAETLEDVLRPKGVAVVSEAIHVCMMMRLEDPLRVHGPDPPQAGVVRVRRSGTARSVGSKARPEKRAALPRWPPARRAAARCSESVQPTNPLPAPSGASKAVAGLLPIALATSGASALQRSTRARIARY